MAQGISRRSFLSGAALAAGAAAAAGLSGCAPQSPQDAMAKTGSAVDESGMAVVGKTPAWLGEAPEIAAEDIIQSAIKKYARAIRVSVRHLSKLF